MNSAEINELIIDIKALLSGIADTKLVGNKNWTNAIKEALTALGKSEKYNCLVCPDEDDKNPEWLYDMTWYKEEEINGIRYMAEIPFIMESEWQSLIKDIKYDFEKLLQSDARLKLMVCNYTGIEKLEELKEYFNTAVKMYKQQNKNSYYLIAIQEYQEIKFEFLEFSSTAMPISEQ